MLLRLLYSRLYFFLRHRTLRSSIYTRYIACQTHIMKFDWMIPRLGSPMLWKKIITMPHPQTSVSPTSKRTLQLNPFSVRVVCSPAKLKQFRCLHIYHCRLACMIRKRESFDRCPGKDTVAGKIRQRPAMKPESFPVRFPQENLHILAHSVCAAESAQSRWSCWYMGKITRTVNVLK